MSVSMLLVEGKLDSSIVNHLLQGRPVVRMSGDKYGLKRLAQSFSEAQSSETHTVSVRFLRDRDFDYDPPEDTSQPQAAGAWGWHWCRHEIENYLLDPCIVAWLDELVDVEAYSDQLRRAAESIRFYEAARWTVGDVRKSLPPNHRLRTKPEEVQRREFGLPQDLSLDSTNQWAREETSRFLADIETSLGSRAVVNSYETYLNRFSATFCRDIDSILAWFSGKDLFGALAPWLQSQERLRNPGQFRSALSEWCRFHREEALIIIPEWQGLLDLLSG